MKKNNIYKNFGNLLLDLREKAGITQQADFTRRIKVTQQTVSRWELGLSRPRHSQISAIAAVLHAESERLFTSAGYNIQYPDPSVISFDQPFPMNRFSSWKTI